MHIHDKFVVVDFNADNPTVFTGSSNLAAGGEEANGDSLAMIQDAAIANMFAIEAVALFDHYHFRKVMQEVTVKEPPLTLWYPGKPQAPTAWWKAYYDLTKIQMRDRYLFAGLPLPAGLAATKNVDWSAVDNAPPATKKAPAKKSAAKSAKAPTAKKAKKAATKKATAKKSSKKKSPKKKPLAKKLPARKSSPKKTVKKKAAKKPPKKTVRKTLAKKKKAAPKKKRSRAKR